MKKETRLVEMIVYECEKCGWEYFLGYTGNSEGCDKCMGIVRDSDGRAWLPGEQRKAVQGYGDYTDFVELWRDRVFGIVE